MTVVRQIPSDAVSVVKMCEFIIAVDELKYVALWLLWHYLVMSRWFTLKKTPHLKMGHLKMKTVHLVH